jgi:iron-sulfur cluster assembly protein
MAITMTQAAIDRIATVKKKRQTPEHYLRVGVRGGGCSGLSYFIDFVELPGRKDKIFEFEADIKVCIDRKSYLFVNGTEIDFKKGLMKTGFEFKNPLSAGDCSCGESFSV